MVSPTRPVIFEEKRVRMWIGLAAVVHQLRRPGVVRLLAMPLVGVSLVALACTQGTVAYLSDTAKLDPDDT